MEGNWRGLGQEGVLGGALCTQLPPFTASLCTALPSSTSIRALKQHRHGNSVLGSHRWLQPRTTSMGAQLPAVGLRGVLTLPRHS